MPSIVLILDLDVSITIENSDLTYGHVGNTQSIPGSTLVLKRGTKEDGSTQSIFASRFRKSD